jgi:hypothetical protein
VITYVASVPEIVLSAEPILIWMLWSRWLFDFVVSVLNSSGAVLLSTSMLEISYF